MRVMIKKFLALIAGTMLMQGAVFSVLANTTNTNHQSTTGTVTGQVMDESGSVIAGAKVVLSNSITGYQTKAQTDETGAFKFLNVPFNNYKVHVEVEGFQASEQAVDVHSAVPLQLTVQMKVSGVKEVVTVTTDDTHMVEGDRASSDTDLNTLMLSKQLGAAPSRGLQAMVATAPGIVTDDGQRIHARGSESNVQTVINGIPVTEAQSAIFSTSIDPRTASHVEVLTGGIPAEFGDKLGAVINVNTKSGLDMPISGEITANIGSFSTGDGAASFGGHLKKFGWFTAFSASTSHRYLDPPTVDNFHNIGRTASNLTALDFNPSNNDQFKVTMMFGGANLEVPNRLDQELAGQDQRQRQRNQSVFASWQHIHSQTMVTNLSAFFRTAKGELFSNPLSTPVAAFQDRGLTNYGLIGSFSYVGHGHTLKAGIQYTRTPVRENFSFYPTDPNAFGPIQDENGSLFPNPVLQFSASNPFTFNNERTGRTLSGFVQDRFSPFKNLTLDLGVRFDDYKLLIHERAASPRIGLAYLAPKTQTVFRLSYNRLFQPPPAENLLLASSEEAARLSPLAVITGEIAVKPVLPDKEHVFEAGVQQQVTKFARLTLSAYNKQIRNFSDKDQFFDTGVIFPVAIFAGRVTGFEARLDTAEWRGLSGFASYANSRAFGITPIVGGLFLGEAVGALANPGLRFPNDHDERNAGQFQINYTHKKSGWWTSFGGRYDSGVPVDAEPGTTLAQFVSEGFDPRLFNEIDFERGRVKPRAIFNFSTGVDLLRNERVGVSAALDVENITNKLFLYNFESVFSGTHVGPPRQWSGRITLKFK